MAYHDEAHFGLFKALTNSVEYEISAYYGSWRSGDAEEPINLEFYYPVVVVEGSLIEGPADTAGHEDLGAKSFDVPAVGNQGFSKRRVSDRRGDRVCLF
jgi:hypothetical protein